MFKGILYQYLLKAILLALIALVLYGVFPGTGLAIILMVFVLLRLSSLAAEALRKPLLVERREGQTQIIQAIPGRIPPRGKRELGAEALGVVAFSIVIPLDIALYTRDFFSLRTPQGWVGAAVSALCILVYVWPHLWLKAPQASDVRIWWWALPFAVGLLALSHAIKTRHPYLNPFSPDHSRLAAERVLSLKNNIVAGRHADWVLRYARQLDQEGKTERAIHFYREGLRLDPNDHGAYKRLTSLETPAPSGLSESRGKSGTMVSGPYWTAGHPIVEPPRCRIGAQLESVEGCTVVIVPVGQVTDRLLDAVGYVIHNELDLPVCISPDTVPLPPHTRVRGVVTGSQWNQASLVQAFLDVTKPFPNAPIRYVLITPVDIYVEDANYVFSSSYKWGALVSSARFVEPKGDDTLLRQRTAKQALCALLKSFKVPASLDRNCVTSYVRTLEEFDAKGNRPNAETLGLFQQTVAQINRQWQRYQASRDSPFTNTLGHPAQR